MTVQLRPYQIALRDDVRAAWRDGHRNVLAVAATGSGKTVLFSDIIHSHDGPAVAIAHRQELVTQISVALARNGVRHRIIGQDSTLRAAVQLHMQEVGRSYVDRNARTAVAGIDTLIRQPNPDPSVTLWVMDEAHHVLTANKWGKGVAMFPNARGLGVTATPGRADGRGLGRHADGVFDTMVEAPGMRDLIRMGYLTDYRIFAPPSDIDLSGVTLAASGDFSPDPLRKAVHRSHIVGDVVEHYIKIAPGKLGVTFAVDVEGAGEIAAAFRASGVPAEVVSAKTPDAVRAAILRRFAVGEIKQLVNVDLFGEGFDLPAIEVVSMARPTQSFGLFSQQFGRALRLMDGKQHALIIDHVGNVHRHGLPDAPREWSLDRREKRSRGAQAADVIHVRTCPKCMGVFERVLGMICPYCGEQIAPAGRTLPEQVDGDLYELDADVLAKMRGEIDAPPAYHPDPLIARSVVARHREKAEAQEALRAAMAAWAGRYSQATDEATVRELQRRFYLTFGVDVLTAQTLGRADAEVLRGRVEGRVDGARIDVPCSHPGCTRVQNVTLSDAKFGIGKWCKEHSPKKGSVDVPCSHPGCTKMQNVKVSDAKFGIGKWCKEHSPKNRRIDVPCSHPGCTQVQNVKRSEAKHGAGKWCKEHSLKNRRIDVPCSHPGCTKMQNVKVSDANSGRGKWCKEHSPRKGSVDVPCSHPGCTKMQNVSASQANSGRGKWCDEHNPRKGSVDVPCSHPGCTRVQNVAASEAKRGHGKWCSEHSPRKVKKK